MNFHSKFTEIIKASGKSEEILKQNKMRQSLVRTVKKKAK